MAQPTISADELTLRFPELLRVLAAGGRVRVAADGVVVAELVRPSEGVAGRGSADAAVAEIVRDMIASGHPPDADSPLWRYVPRAA